jgi:hypothetical protein
MVVPPEGSPMAQPQPRPAAAESLTARWRDHPGTAWAARIYAEHRPMIRDFDGPSPY